MGGRKTQVLGSGMLPRVARNTKRFNAARRRAKDRRHVFEETSKRRDESPDIADPSTTRRQKDEATEARTTPTPRSAGKGKVLHVRLAGEWFDHYCRELWRLTPELETLASAVRNLRGEALIDEVRQVLEDWSRRTGAVYEFVPPAKVPGYHGGNWASMQGNKMLIAETIIEDTVEGMTRHEVAKKFATEVGHDMGVHTTGKKIFVKGPRGTPDATAHKWLDMAVEAGVTSVDDHMAMWWRWVSK